MRSAWLLVGCLTATVLVTTALMSALASFYESALPAAVSSELAEAGSAMSIAISGEVSGPPAAQAAGVTAKLTAALGPVPYRLYQATWSNDLAVSGAARPGQIPVVQAATVGGIAASAELTSGRWPAAPQPGRPIPAALPASAASDLGLRTGSLLRLRDLNAGRQVTLQISGLYRPRQPSAPYWQLDTIGTAGVAVASGFAAYGPAVVSPAAFGNRGGLTASQVSFVALPRVASFTAAELTPVAGRVAAAAGAIDSAGQLTATTAMPQVLGNAAASLAAAKSLVVISGLQLLLLAAAALALASRLLASNREWETALLAARGAGRRQLIGAAMAEGALAAAVSAAAGVVAGGWLAAALLDRLTGHAPRVTAPSVTMWLAGAMLAAVCVGIVLWPTVRPGRPAEVRIRRGRSAPVTVVFAAGADIALVVLAVLAVRELRSYSATAQVASGSGIDPVIAVAPVLALAGLAVVPLRLLPVAAKGLERLSARSSRLGSAMANWEISRRPLRQSGPVLLVILTVGASTIALAQYQSWRQSVHDQAAFAVGAPVRVEITQAEPLAGAGHIAGLPGVTSAMPVSDVELPTAGQFLVLDSRLAARTVTLRSDLSGQPASQLFRAITPRVRPGLVLPGRPVRLGISASMTSPAGAPGLGPVFATLTVQDADGVGYSVVTSAVPADGRSHLLVAKLGAAAGAVYPLRLLGVSVSYSMPAYQLSARARIAGESAVLRLDGLSVSQAATGRFTQPFAAGRALSAWQLQGTEPGLAGEIQLLSGNRDDSDALHIDASGPAGSAVQVRFDPGHGPLIPSSLLFPGSALGVSATPPGGQAELALAIPASARPVPVIATAGYAAANGLHNGAVFGATIAGEQVGCQLVATVANFPAGAALVADQAAVQDALASRGLGGSLPVSSWWLATVHGAVPAGLPAGSAVSDTAALAQRLESDPLSAAPVQAAAAVAAAAALLAGLGFCVSVAASVRERRPQRALLGALGVPARTQAWLFCLEEALISIPAAAFGLAIGAGLAQLLIPALTVNAVGGMPVLPVTVTLPTGWVVGIAAGLPAIPVLVAALAALRRPDPAAELRAAEGVA